MRITVTALLWYDPKGKWNKTFVYKPGHVNRLKRMVDRHLSIPHDFVCIHDGTYPASDFDPDIRLVPLDRSTMKDKGGFRRFPKLMIFRPDAAELIGDRILLMDVDTVVTGSMDHVVDRPEDLVLWRNPAFGRKRRSRYNSSLVLLRAGARPLLWTSFNLEAVLARLEAQNIPISDQHWITENVAPDEAHWTGKDGVYWCEETPFSGGKLPANAAIVTFPGRRDPSMKKMQRKFPWIKDHWR
jgi:hypothetical protein